ncbi:uncharacterized protein LOC103039965 isoform X2 [Astyanax mexicanus]|uniref:uncharacterized protein LOC103039965 isoform X2 n=1 Tax=Astyanax mexicanus TaxID=7994 RepID=UPI0020CAE666|nr:uncharacterized protein LOC103039965 isoform X2 [Astyanax mexicanus]
MKRLKKKNIKRNYHSRICCEVNTTTNNKPSPKETGERSPSEFSELEHLLNLSLQCVDGTERQTLLSSETNMSKNYSESQRTVDERRSLPAPLYTSGPHSPAPSTQNRQFNITLQCKDICSSGQCTFPVPDKALPHLQNKQCEQEWFTQDGYLLADGSSTSPNRTLHPLVLDVTRTSLTTRYCISGHQYVMNCHDSKIEVQTQYSAVNNSRGYRSSDNIRDTTVISILLPTLGAVVFSLGLTLYCLRSRIRALHCLSD